MRPVCSVVDTSVCPAGDRVGLAAVLKSSQNLWGAGNPSDNPSPSDNPRESRTPSNPGTWGAMTRRLGRIVQPVLWGHPLFWDPQTGSLASGTQVCRASASFLVAPHLISRSRNQERTLGLFQQRLLLSLLQTLSNLSFGEPKGRMGRAEPDPDTLHERAQFLLPGRKEGVLMPLPSPPPPSPPFQFPPIPPHPFLLHLPPAFPILPSSTSLPTSPSFPVSSPLWR